MGIPPEPLTQAPALSPCAGIHSLKRAPKVVRVRGCLQLRFDRQKTHEPDTGTAPETGVGLDSKDAWFSIVQAVPEDLLVSVFILPQFQPERQLLNVLVEPVSHPACHFHRCEYDTDLRIMIDRPGIQVQGPDENLFSIENE
jgi:hypothetical protein